MESVDYKVYESHGSLQEVNLIEIAEFVLDSVALICTTNKDVFFLDKVRERNINQVCLNYSGQPSAEYFIEWHKDSNTCNHYQSNDFGREGVVVIEFGKYKNAQEEVEYCEFK